MSSRIISTTLAAELLGIHPATLREWARRGWIGPAIRTKGGHYRFARETIEKWKQEHQAELQS